jgi:sugar lactone lactonase YvrE
MATLSSSRKPWLVFLLALSVVSGLITFEWLARTPVSAAAQQRAKKKRTAMQQRRERRSDLVKPRTAAEKTSLRGPLLSQNEPTSRSRFSQFEYQSEPFTSRQLYDKPREAASFFRLKRLPEGAQELPLEKYAEAHEQMQKMPVYSTARAEYLTGGPAAAVPLTEQHLAPDQATWAPLGPGNVGGRTRALLIDPQDASLMYAAGVAGGVWKTTNGGQSWTPSGDQLANLAVSCLAFDPKNSQIIYAGTGEGFFNIDSVRGNGIFKTTDGGATWKPLVDTQGLNFHYVNDIVVSPSNSQKIYAATNTGVWRTLDGGTDWRQALIPRNADFDTITGGCLDLAIRTDKLDADHVFAACGTFEQATIYLSKNAGGPAQSLSTSFDPVFTEAGMGRTALALSPSNQDVIYAVSASVESGAFEDALHAVFRSTSGGDAGTWTAQVRNTNANKLNRSLLSLAIFSHATDCGYYTEDDFIGQGWYDLAIAVDPLDPNRVWVGGIDLFRSDDGGANWGLATHAYQPRENPQYAHPDQHILVFHPQYNGTTNQILYAGNDGGLWRTNNARAAVATGNSAACKASNTAVTWTSLNNGYGVTQFYHGSVLPDGKSYFGGTQDNGTLLGTDQQGSNAWREINGGDGGYTAVDPAGPNTLYASYTGISMYKSTDGGATFSSAQLGLNDPGGLFISPYVMDSSDASRLWTGGAYLWRTTNGASLWTRASALTAGTGYVSALAVAPTDANYILAGMSDGYLLRTALGLTATSTTVWAGTQPRRGYVSWVAFDPNNKSIAYATFSNFGGTHVWRSTNGGESWAPLDGSGTGALPDVPVHCIVIDPANTARMYIGTDVGVFVTNDGGSSWALESTGFPNVITESLALHVVNGETWLYAFTHGRGAWRVKLNNNGCNFAIAPATVNASTGGQSGTLNVQAQPNGCIWTATSNASWLQVTGSGSSSGTVNFVAAPNTGVNARTATATIAGRSFVVIQPGLTDVTPPTLAITEPNPATTANDVLGSITVRGTAADNGALAAITWSNDRGGSGTASGTTNWTISSLPLAAGLNTITITARDTANNVARAMVMVNSRPASLILTLAGNGNPTASGDGQLAVQAQLGLPSSLVFDMQGNLYIADTYNDRIRKVNASDGKILTVAGGAGNGYAGDGGPATAARMNCPTGVAVDAQGNIYIADRDNNRVRRVAVADGMITTFAGTGTGGYSGDNGDAKSAQLNKPTNVVLDAQGNVYIADSLNHRIRKVATDGKITTVAGLGTNGSAGDNGPATAAQLNSPIGLAIDGQGNLFIADTNNHKLRRVNAENGVITTLAGTGTRGSNGDGGDARNAQLGAPEGVWVDPQNNVIIADTFNDRVRRISASDGRISTIAGNGLTGYTGDGTSATSTRMFCPTSVITDLAGRLYIADRENHRVRVVQAVPTGDTTPPAVALTAPTTNPTFTTTTSPLTLTGTALDANGIVQVRWLNDRGFAGTASGTTAWTAANIPLLIGLNNLTVTAFDLGGNAASVALAVTFDPAQVIVTVAGSGIAGGGGDGGAAAAAQLRQPVSVAVDGQGNLYVADTYNHRVRKVTPSGVIMPFAGNGVIGSNGDNGPATEANLNEPITVLADSAGNVYIGDYRNHRVRKAKSPRSRAPAFSAIRATGARPPRLNLRSPSP